MKYHQFEIVLQEVPGEISLSFSITGCSLRCKGCHSPFLWKKENGMLLSVKEFKKKLNQYPGFATCVLFMGGEWHEEKLVELLKIANQKNYKTCLYSGEEKVSPSILLNLDWVKTGKWNPQKGGLNSSNTNQKFTHVQTNTQLNHLFLKTNSYDSINSQPSN
jgi:anaerobic ribonucleoside-triphosphate reductase activating protein